MWSICGNFAGTSESFRFGGLLCPNITLVSTKILVAEDRVNKSQLPLIIFLGESKPGVNIETKNKHSSVFCFSALYVRLFSRFVLHTLITASRRMLSGYPRLLKCCNIWPVCLIKLHGSLHMQRILNNWLYGNDFLLWLG